MPEVDATGMLRTYSGVCERVYSILMHTCPNSLLTYWRGYHSVSFTVKGNLRASISERAEVETHVFRFVG